MKIMKLPKELITVTPLSKLLAITLFVSLPVVGFLVGIRYQEMMDLGKRQQIEQNLAVPRTPTPTPIAIPTVDPSVTANWKTYTNMGQGFSFKYPPNWQVAEPSFESGLILYTSNLKTTYLEKYKYDIIQKGAVINVPYTPGVVMDYKSLDELVNDFKSSSQNVLSIQEKDFLLDGQTAKIITTKRNSYSSVDILFKYKVRTFETDYSFISLDSENENFKKYQQDFDQILSTFQFTTP